ncbi:MAG: Asp-tRNA(Asn)/Glu-tRNA(Gln) amidotransferase subunit GatC [Bacilli bacterium]|nr:Asp-tRNA(Asn)/Glu-tRNA(Gln) amidotransferase subunit GatC [Bacilli bacterium]
MLSKEEVEHVSNLARISIKENEYELYAKQLHDILSDIEKINEVELTSDDILISTTKNINKYSTDEIKPMLKKEEIFKNVKDYNGDFIVVPKVIDND